MISRPRHSAQPRRIDKTRPHYATTRQARAARRQTAVPASASMPKRVFVLCHYCGYTPPGDVPRDGICPKCKGSSWERFALSERLVPAHMK